MSATISSPVVQLVFGFGNPILAKWLVDKGLLSGRLATEDVNMFADKGFVAHLGRASMLAGVAAIVMTSVGPSAAIAAPAQKGTTVTTGTSGATDFSARRYYRGYRGGGAAAAAAFAGIVGTGIAIAAAKSRRDYYEPYGYGYGYGGPAVVYAPAYGGYGYGGGYYGQQQNYGGYDTGMRPYGGW